MAERKKLEADTGIDLSVLNEINDATTRAVAMNRDLWKLAAKIDMHFGREPTLPPQLPPELLDDLNAPMI